MSIEGTTFIEGKRGDGKYTILFDNIEQIVFRLKGDNLMGTVKLMDGELSELIMNKGHSAYGRTKYGTFQIKLLDLKKIIIAGLGRK